MLDFLMDLDEYFCENYANYSKICGLKGYEMPKMQDTKIDEYGRESAYTLPMSTMRLALQKNKEALLAELKTKLVDKTFSFSFLPYTAIQRIENLFSKTSFYKHWKKTVETFRLDEEEIGRQLSISPEIWRNICKGKFAPTKNLLFSMALVQPLPFEKWLELLASCGYVLNYEMEKDVVLSYLMQQKVSNREMIDKALQEYHVDNLFLA